MALSKVELRDELLRVLAEALEAAERAHKTTREGATHAEAKPENDKDTRALEQTYLARGQAMRVEELRAGMAEVRSMPVRDFAETEAASLGALVTLEEDDEERLVFLAPQGGGSLLGEARVSVVTPKSPLGQALLGKRAGDDCEVTIGGRRREMVLSRVQ
jgi:transcription elongation GreA/GreB family factor